MATFIAGPCVIESMELLETVAQELLYECNVVLEFLWELILRSKLSHIGLPTLELFHPEGSERIQWYSEL